MNKIKFIIIVCWVNGDDKGENNIRPPFEMCDIEYVLTTVL